MQVRVKYFAILREMTGQAEESIDCDEASTVGDLLAMLEQKYPSIGPHRTKIAIAVNHQYANLQTPLTDQAEVALLPPVAGGASEDAQLSEVSEASRFQILDTPLQPDVVSAQVAGEFGGAIVTFTGMVRRQSQGRTVERLIYEAYGPMALKELTNIGEEIETQWPEAKVAIHHRVGTLSIGELAVVIAVCTPHRQAAFEACSHAIERLKQTVPIWKQEFFTDGSQWVGWGP